jgi:predicted signal transduction protein with EAL and GGDEF domain/DNA-binding response OmpR family regulator
VPNTAVPVAKTELRFRSATSVDDSSLPIQVLLIDDDEVNLLLTTIALTERGFVVTPANGGQEGLKVLRSLTPDIIVLDALMPGVDGFETCRRLRATPGLDTLPVLMLTGLDDDASIARAYEVGATDFYVKSPQWSLLSGRLHYMLRAARTRTELERSKGKLARAQDLARMGSFEFFPDRSNGVRLSQEAARVLGLGANQVSNLGVSLRSVMKLVPATERRLILSQLHAALRRSKTVTTDLALVLPDGRQRTIHVEAEPEFNDSGQGAGYAGIVQDVTDRRVAEDKIRQLANFDALTGLPNRRHLIWRAERALEQAKRYDHQCALLLIDLDRFKLFNDTLGHAAGDELLVEVGRRLRACVHHSEHMLEGTMLAQGPRFHRALEAVGRLGGDEFVVLLPEVVDEAAAQQVAQRMLEALRRPMYLADQECFVTGSVGLALFPRDGTTVVDLLRNADDAMYSAKAHGKNSAAVYRPQLTGRGREKLALETALHKAIERNEIVLHYQPKVDVRGARMAGAEALMRWQRGDKLLPPGEFLPLAEESGLIVPLSEWALREAAKQARVGQERFGFADAIAVNMPSRLFERSDLVERIHSSVKAANVQHRAIQLEITEDALMKDLQNVIPSLHRLNEIGVEISIDDFGTGYSSLAYLTSLPISELKIDRSFVRDLGVTPQSAAVVTAIIALARSLGLRVVAEGVETMRQMEVLHRLGCGLMQGYLFSKAVPSEDLITWHEQTVLPRRAPWLASAPEQSAPQAEPMVGLAAKLAGRSH